MNGSQQPQVKSILAKLNKLAQERGLTGPQITTLFLLERAAVRLMTDLSLQKHLVFKGGYIGVRVYNSQRYTTDLDAALRGMSPEEAIMRIRAVMELELGDATWFRFESVNKLVAQGDYGGTGIVFRGGLGQPPQKLVYAQRIHIDLGIGDPVTPQPRTVNTGLTIGEGVLTWLVYPIESILAEKIHALVKLGAINSRSKDVYDVFLFLPQADPELLRLALRSTFTFRGDETPELIWSKLQNLDIILLQRGWITAVAAIKSPPSFEEAFGGIVSLLREWQL